MLSTEERDEQREKVSELLSPLCVSALISSVHPNEYAIELFPSLLSSKLAAREVEQNIPDTNDREQKSLTTGSISPKQKTLHNIL